MTASLRAAGPADAETMAAIHGSVATRGWSAADFGTWLARPDAFAFLAVGAPGPVGVMGDAAIAFGLALVAGEEAEILMIATTPRARRHGAGRAILRALIEETGRRRLGRLILEVARNNQPALGLYRSEGFMEIGARSGYYRQAGGLVDALVLARSASSADSTR